jgi:isopenicillin N synthase-like dioxygenase
MGSLPPDNIPTVNISAFLDPNASEQAKNEVVENVRDACTTYGFFHMTGHGVTDKMRQGMLECTKRFFDLPMDDRMEVCVQKSMGRSFRGYEPPLIQTHHEGLLPDTKEVRSFQRSEGENNTRVCLTNA